MRKISASYAGAIVSCVVALACAVVGGGVRAAQRAEAVETPTLDGKPAKRFSTAGHAKSKGVELTIGYPVDWSADETKGSNGVKMFVNPTSTATVTIGTKTAKRPLSKDEAAKLLADREGVAPLFPSSTKVLAFQPTKLGGEPAAHVECTDSREQAGNKVYSRSIFLVFVQGDTLVMIHCMVAGAFADAAVVEKNFESHRELFNQMLGTVVLGGNSK